MSNEISINQLLSTCADACSRGCQVIKHVNEKRCSGHQAVQANTDEEKENMNVVYKVADDPRSALTEADLASQRVILHCLRHEWGNELNIIGEEDDSDSPSSEEKANPLSDEQVFTKYDVPTPNESPIKYDLCSDEEIMFSLSDLTLYIDPMDGTREFVEQRLHNVQCLIGIAWKGQPVGGVIGLPFLFNETSNGTDVHIVTALHWGKSSFVKTVQVTKGKSPAKSDHDAESAITSIEDLWLSLGNCASPEAKQKANECNGNILSVFSGDSNRIHKKHALEYLETLLSGSDTSEETSATTNTILDVCIAGGCGNKILRTAASAFGGNCGNALSVIPPGTCSWDTAAPSAVLLAAMATFGIEAKVTDMFGGELIYSSEGHKVTNDLGAFVSIGTMATKYHEKLCEYFRGNDMILNSLLKRYWSFHSNDSNQDNGDAPLMAAHKEAQAIDFVRGMEGYVLSCAEIKTMLVSEQITPLSSRDTNLIGYSIPEKGANRGSEENGERVDKCVMHLFWEETADDANDTDDDAATTSSIVTLPSTVLYERILKSDNDRKLIVKLTSS